MTGTVMMKKWEWLAISTSILMKLLCLAFNINRWINMSLLNKIIRDHKDMIIWTGDCLKKTVVFQANSSNKEKMLWNRVTMIIMKCFNSNTVTKTVCNHSNIASQTCYVSRLIPAIINKKEVVCHPASSRLWLRKTPLVANKSSVVAMKKIA